MQELFVTVDYGTMDPTEGGGDLPVTPEPEPEPEYPTEYTAATLAANGVTVDPAGVSFAFSIDTSILRGTRVYSGPCVVPAAADGSWWGTRNVGTFNVGGGDVPGGIYWFDSISNPTGRLGETSVPSKVGVEDRKQLGAVPLAGSGGLTLSNGQVIKSVDATIRFNTTYVSNANLNTSSTHTVSVWIDKIYVE